MEFNLNDIFSVTFAAIAIFLKQLNFIEPVFSEGNTSQKMIKVSSS